MREKKKIDPDVLDQFVEDIVRSLPKNLKEKLEFADKEALSKKEAQNLAARVLLGMMESRVGIYAVAEAALQDPMALAKLQVALVPKNVQIEETKRVQHTIVVPEMQTVEQWMAARHLTGTTTDELGFEHVTVEIEDADPK